MARFASKYARFSHGVPEKAFVDGQTVNYPAGLEAQFRPGGLSKYEIEVALEALTFQGLPEWKDTGALVDPTDRLSVFDSKKAQADFFWPDEIHDHVVETLRNSEQNGISFIELEQQKRPAPWPGYDGLDDVEKIAELTVATGTSPEDVLAYEKENEAREEVISALEEILGIGVEEDEVVIQG